MMPQDSFNLCRHRLVPLKSRSLRIHHPFNGGLSILAAIPVEVCINRAIPAAILFGLSNGNIGYHGKLSVASSKSQQLEDSLLQTFPSEYINTLNIKLLRYLIEPRNITAESWQRHLAKLMSDTLNPDMLLMLERFQYWDMPVSSKVCLIHFSYVCCLASWIPCTLCPS